MPENGMMKSKFYYKLFKYSKWSKNRPNSPNSVPSNITISRPSKIDDWPRAQWLDLATNCN